MSKRRAFARVVLPSVLAWLLARIPLLKLMDYVPPIRFEFGLPLVSVPYTPGADVVSLVPDLFSALTLSVLVWTSVEVSKSGVSALTVRRSLCYWLLFLYQAALFIDILRRNTWDWYGYLLYFCRLIALSYERPRPEIIPLPAPWLSFVLLVAVILVAAKSLETPKPDPRGPESGALPERVET